jgi:ubiquinone/menaquinone biosynthesis C-methylase UbiE
MQKKLGDFSGLAQNYSKFRPSYSPIVAEAILGLTGKPQQEIDFVDVGAGTGIWTRLVAKAGLNSVTAIEPNDDMRTHGTEDSKNFHIKWIKGSGEHTGLSNNSADVLTMASSFHWVDFNEGLQEFSRVLRQNGIFSALWNPRFIERNPLLVEIEEQLYSIAPHIKRISSGNSRFTETLTEKLLESSLFSSVIYLEGLHTVEQTPEEYIGVWWSVNDIRAQAGEKKFAQFMNYIEKRIEGLTSIETTYKTRAWAARVK